MNVFGDFVATENSYGTVFFLALLVGLSVIGFLNRERIVRLLSGES